MCIRDRENVVANNAPYSRNSKNKQQSLAVRNSIGRLQQAQIELMRVMDRLEVKYVLHNPQAGNWADNKALFESATGWKGRSNRDNRSGAYFGMLEVR